jgi:hypothetical protein
MHLIVFDVLIPISVSVEPALTFDFPKLPETRPVVLSFGLIFERLE